MDSKHLMEKKSPHLVQYQGSKRILAPKILNFFPKKVKRLIEPFAGMAAISIAAANYRNTNSFCINDLNSPLINLLKEVVIYPEQLADNYSRVWNEQFSFENGNHVNHFYKIRNDFNDGATTPENMLYLLARCVKGAVRYCKNGKFNQSPDKRRHGTNPKKIKESSLHISSLLKNKTSFLSKDYNEILDFATSGDLIYMDPPYQGVSNVRDNRYFAGVLFDDFVNALEQLNKKNIDYIISYDGACGDKEYGKDLPLELDCKKIILNAGLSSQSTLLGKKSITYESLYVSKNLIHIYNNKPKQLFLSELIA